MQKIPLIAVAVFGLVFSCLIDFLLPTQSHFINISGVHSFVSLSEIGYQKSGRIELFDIFLYNRKLILKYHIVLSVCYSLIGFVRHFSEIT